ncbi:hypothetical protein G5576_009935, partial [Homo sapiens]
IPQARALLQQCLHARLQIRPADGDVAAQWVEVTSARQLSLSSGVRGGFFRVVSVTRPLCVSL